MRRAFLLGVWVVGMILLVRAADTAAPLEASPQFTNQVAEADSPSAPPPSPEVQIPPAEEMVTNAVPAAPAEAERPTAQVAAQAVLDRLGPAVDSLSSRLAVLEASLVLQHQRSLEAGQQSTRTILIVAGCFATAALLGALMAAVILSRALQHVSDVVVAALPASRQLPPANALPALGGGELSTSVAAPALEPVGPRFLGAIEQLEKRIGELEHSVRDAVAPGSTRSSGPNGGGNALEFSVSALQQKAYPDAENAAPAPDPLGALLGKGQALLNLGQTEEAMACFDQVVAANPKHADAHVKRGMALEKLGRLDAALASYDQAIAADAGLTLAYLYKGAVCNRLQRFREALECYESALRCEQKQVA